MKSFNPSIKIKNICALTFALLTLTLTMPATMARADSGILDPLDKTALKEGTVDGASLIERMHQRATALRNYSFNYKMKVFKKNGSVLESGSFYFKKPNYIRLEEKGPYKKGAVAIIGPNTDGRVKAHLGGGLKLFVVDLSPHSGLLKSANGHPMVQSDFLSLAECLKDYEQKGMTTVATAAPVRVKGVGKSVYILDIKSGKTDKQLWKRIAVDPRSYVPVQWWDYNQNGNLHSHAQWQDFLADRSLPDQLFTIKHGSSAKKQLLEMQNSNDTVSKNKDNKTNKS